MGHKPKEEREEEWGRMPRRLHMGPRVALSCCLSPTPCLHPAQHLLGGEAQLLRAALPRYVPSLEGGDSGPRVTLGRGVGEGISYTQRPSFSSQCLEAGARGQSGQRAPSPARAKQGPAPGPAPALLLSMGVPCALERWKPSIRGRPVPAPPRAQVWCPHEACVSSPPEVTHVCSNLQTWGLLGLLRW